MQLETVDTLVSVGDHGELVLTWYVWLSSGAGWRANGPFRAPDFAQRYGATSRRAFFLERRFSAGPPAFAEPFLTRPAMWHAHPLIAPRFFPKRADLADCSPC